MITLITEKSADYELLDSGSGEKLERYGKVVLSRPDPQAIWSKKLTDTDWKKADAVFTRAGTSGKWQIKNNPPEPWEISLCGLKFALKLLPSKHLGVFPEQSSNWQWLTDKISNFQFPISSKNQKIQVLNLFAYTGGASMACAKAGAEVCHVDASKFVVDAAHKNLELSGLKDKSVRFIVDDVRKFVEREIKRGKKYDIILMDPPVYGKGVKGEAWNIDTDLAPLVLRLKSLLSEKPVAIVLNGYASGYSHLTYAELLKYFAKYFNSSVVTSGELAIKESSGDRVLPCGIFARLEIEN